MHRLIEGIQRFRESLNGCGPQRFAHLAKVQQPEALFITCADAGINPNLITQTEPGELCILRNAGNLVPPHGAGAGGEEPTIELAVRGFGVRDIIVCGHTHCHAMAGLLDRDLVADLPAVSAWLRQAEATRWIVRTKYPDLTGEALLRAAVEENVLVQMENLRTHPAVAARLACGDLTLHGWFYEVETGEVLAYDDSVGRFLPLMPYPATSHPPPESLTAVAG